jgi:hypothetical protein
MPSRTITPAKRMTSPVNRLRFTGLGPDQPEREHGGE